MFEETRTFSSFSVKNKSESIDFYTNILGLKITEHEIGFLQLHTHGNNPIMIYEKENHEPATFTILNFTVENIEEIVDGLTSKGVVFEQYDKPMKTDEKGIYTNEQGSRIAWFKDPSENHIAVIQQ